MFKQVYDKLEKEVSGEIAFNYVSEISRNHRIQASPGLRSAVNFAVDTLRDNGIDAEVQSYPANGEDFAWSSFMFKEWSCNDANLKLIEPEEEAQFLARWDESKLSLIQRSYPTPKVGLEAEVIHIGKGEEEKDYEGVDVAGKMVLSNGDVSRVHELAVEKHGAKGIIYYGTWIHPPVLPEGELDDALKYTSYWWTGAEEPGLGFVLTPRKGRWLRDLIDKCEKPVKIHTYVDSKIYDGTLDNAVATIKGEIDETVLIIAHICHPQPSCNDNASGSAAAMEAARALNKLIEEGLIDRPKRTIKFTLVPEMSGSYAYLAANEDNIPKMIAALNLDMVGEKQCLTSSSLIIERTPDSYPSYVNSLVETIFKEIQGEVKNLGGSGKYPLFRHTITPFSGGSDHYIYSDPTVGIPCPMIIQWPDKFWHTSLDTMDKVDPEMLRKIALLTATYAYTIANADEETAIWLASQTLSSEKKRALGHLHERITRSLNEGENITESFKSLEKQVNYWIERSSLAVRSVKSLAPESSKLDEKLNLLIEHLETSIKSELEMEQNIFKELLKSPKDNTDSKHYMSKMESEAHNLIPERIYRGPVSTRYWERRMDEEDREAYRGLLKENEDDRILTTLAVYWTDGERSIKEVSDLVGLETGRTNLDFISKYFRFLEKMGLVEIHEQ
jgi:hypothetical protein